MTLVAAATRIQELGSCVGENRLPGASRSRPSVNKATFEHGRIETKADGGLQVDCSG